MISTITLNPSIDQHITVEKLVKDDANRALSITRDPGGKGVNVSKAIRELGGKTYAYALIGGLPGELWEALLRKRKIGFYAVPIKGDTRINTILTDVADHTQTRVSAPGPLVSRKEMNRLLKKLFSCCPKTFLWALGGSLPQGLKQATYRDIIFSLQKKGVPCILDTDNDALWLGIEAKPFMIKPNEYEMQRLLGKSMRTLDDYLAGARSLVRKGIKIVIVSLGKRGALVATAEEAFHVSTPDVPVKSKVGAGDSLIGGFALGLYRKMSVREAARLGVAASASAVMTEGVRLCRREDIRGLLSRVTVRSL